MAAEKKYVFKLSDLPFLESTDGTLRDSFSVTDETCGAQEVTAGIVFIRPHSECHTDTHDVEEIFYIIEGRGKLTFDGKPVEVKAGDVVFMPSGVAHSVINDYDETYVAFWAILQKWSDQHKLKAEVDTWHEIEPNTGWSKWPFMEERS